LELGFCVHQDPPVLQLETGIHAFEIETVCHYSGSLIHRIGQLVKIDLRDDVKTCHSCSSPQNRLAPATAPSPREPGSDHK
jgi:hypothetical protein